VAGPLREEQHADCGKELRLRNLANLKLDLRKPAGL
jgi:hypothetical protein